MGDRHIQAIFIASLLTGIVAIHHWRGGESLFSADNPDLHSMISNEVTPAYQMKQQGSHSSEPFSPLSVSKQPAMTVWQQDDRISFSVPYSDDLIRIILKEDISLSGRVYAVNRVHRDFADLAPFYIAYGIGAAVEDRIAEQVNVGHTNRTAIFSRVPKGVGALLGNMHLIPASNEIRRALDTARPNDAFHLQGYLATVYERGHNPWDSDTQFGNSACEIIVVTGFLNIARNGKIHTETYLANPVSLE